MAFGTFTLTIGGERQDNTPETTAKLHLRSQAVDTLRDGDGDEFKFPTRYAHPAGVAVSLPIALTLFTDSTSGDSTTIGYEGWVSTSNGGRVEFQFAAPQAGSTIALTDVTPAVIVPVNEAMQYVAAAEAAAADAEDSEIAAEAAAAEAAAFGGTTDAQIASRVNDPASATRGALSATYGAPAVVALGAQTDRRGQADREKSYARAVVDASTAVATETVEDWADLTGWNQVGVQVSGGKLYGAAGASHGAQTDIDLDKPFRLKAHLQYVGGGAGLIFIGVAADNTAVAPVGGKIIGIGINVGTGKMMSWNRGTTVEAAGTASPGSFLVTVVGDATSITLTLTSSSGFIEHRLRVLRSTFVSCDGIALWNSDSALTSGAYVGPVTLRAGAKVTATDRRVENLGPSVEWNPVNGQNVHIATPSAYDSRKPCPVLLFNHGAGGDELQPLAHFPQLYTELLSDGFLIASTYAHGDNWGNANAQADLLDLYRYLRDTYTLGPVVLWSNSMGGLAGLSTVAAGTIPLAGWIGTQPVCDLDAIYATGAFTTAIRTAYGVAGDGSDYAAKTAGANPMSKPGHAFRGLPMRFYSSPSDTVVAKAQHTNPMAEKVAPFAAEATIVTTSGDHGDASHWATQRTDLKAFINRCVAS